MILKRLTLVNFGIYRGVNSIELTPVSDEQPIILVGGLNGGGKTTLLDAIQLVFFGRNANCSNRGKSTYKDFLRSCINRNAEESEGTKIEITFERIVEGKRVQFRLVRQWRKERDNIIENVSVQKNEQVDLLLSEHWEEYIEGYLPSRLAQLFFFDGEQIKELADSETASRILATAVQVLLGLDVVDKLDDDLSTLEKRKKQSAISESEQQRFNEMKTAIEAVSVACANAEHEKTHLEHKADLLRQDLAALQDQFRQSGGDLHLKRDELQSQLTSSKAALSECSNEFRKILSGMAPLLIIESLLEKVEEQAEAEVEYRHQKIIAQAETNRDKQILKELRKLLPGNDHTVIEQVLAKTRPKREGKDFIEIIHPDEDFPENLRHLLKSGFPHARTELDGIRKKQRELAEAVARQEQQLAAIPDADSLAKIQREITRVEAQVREADAQIAVQKERIRQLASEHKSKETTLRNALDSIVDQQYLREHDTRILHRLPKVRETLRQFRRKVIERHSSKLERLIFESFQQLLRKADLVKGLRIDPDTFKIELISTSGALLPFDRLSAGERQLLATAMLWGLAKASGRPLPTIIDTPLGRLDSSHRAHLVQRYFPIASHQVILLSTDEEIDEKYLAMMKPFVGRTYRLQYSDAMQSTQIIEGYLLNEASS